MTRRATVDIRISVYPDGSALLVHEESKRSIALGTDGGAHASIEGTRVHLGLFMLTQWMQWLATGETWAEHYPEGL